MSGKRRNILIGVLAAVLVIGGVWLLTRTPDNFRDKYELMAWMFCRKAFPPSEGVFSINAPHLPK